MFCVVDCLQLVQLGVFLLVVEVNFKFLVNLLFKEILLGDVFICCSDNVIDESFIGCKIGIWDFIFYYCIVCVYLVNEFMYIFDGGVCFVELDGSVVLVEWGDVVFVLLGVVIGWESSECVVKYYVVQIVVVEGGK